MGEIETEAEKTRPEIASRLRELVEGLDGDGAVTLALGGQRVRLDPTNPVTFELDRWREARKAPLDVATGGQ